MKYQSVLYVIAVDRCPHSIELDLGTAKRVANQLALDNPGGSYFVYEWKNGERWQDHKTKFGYRGFNIENLKKPDLHWFCPFSQAKPKITHIDNAGQLLCGQPKRPDKNGIWYSTKLEEDRKYMAQHGVDLTTATCKKCLRKLSIISNQKENENDDREVQSR